MHEQYNYSVDPYLKYAITVFCVIFGLIFLVKKTAYKYFVILDHQDSPNCSSIDTDSSSSMPGFVSSGESCAVCGSFTTKNCARCKTVKYCSVSCQTSHWHSGHKDECKDFRLPCKSRLQGRRNSTTVALCPGTGTPKQIKKILFPYDKFVELFNWNNQVFPPCGLLNCGNSCFANVVLQCLAYTRPLAAYLLEKGHRSECRRNDWCFLCELQTHLERARRSNSAFSPVNILSRLPNIGGNLGYGKQEDAHEFMRLAIDTMQSVCLDEYGGERSLHPSSQETTLIHHIFGGRLQSQVICTKCNNVSNQFENMMDLTVEIHGDAASLEECLDQFTVKEWLDGDNKYKCDGCNDYVLAWKRLNIHTAPNILTIALKRFQSGRFGKLNKRVTFPETLDLSPYMSEAADSNDIYKLYGVVVHVDMLNASYFGHYICYTKDFSGNWYRIDDCKVEAVELDEVLAQGAYMLLYSRVSARQSCFNPIKKTCRKETLQTSNVSQEKAPNVTLPVDCSLAAESADATAKCGTLMHSNDLSANVSTSQNTSDKAIEMYASDSSTESSVTCENGNCSNDGLVAIEEATLPIDASNCLTVNDNGINPASIQSDIDDNIRSTMDILNYNSTNGEEVNGTDSPDLGCKPKEPESTLSSTTVNASVKLVKTISSAAKDKPLFRPGFLGKRPRPRKIPNNKKDEKGLESVQVNGDLKSSYMNIDITESNNEPLGVVNGGGSNEVVGKEDVYSG
uniref:ubiquitin carboxyl-terminal hydrolase 18-like n=1 Tax=Erigeron canadensis TaxID=72917 RepID=UPI001CB92223|nr:ubiquitin carboxyl-terminal hydrolase 18-like [Erigeron canadensis]